MPVGESMGFETFPALMFLPWYSNRILYRTIFICIKVNLDQLSILQDLATLSQKYKKPQPFLTGALCRLQESNQGHMDFQSIALPTELKRHCLSTLPIKK